MQLHPFWLKRWYITCRSVSLTHTRGDNMTSQAKTGSKSIWHTNRHKPMPSTNKQINSQRVQFECYWGWGAGWETLVGKQVQLNRVVSQADILTDMSRYSEQTHKTNSQRVHFEWHRVFPLPLPTDNWAGLYSSIEKTTNQGKWTGNLHQGNHTNSMATPLPLLAGVLARIKGQVKCETCRQTSTVDLGSKSSWHTNRNEPKPRTNKQINSQRVHQGFSLYPYPLITGLLFFSRREDDYPREMNGKPAPSKPYRQYGYSKAYLIFTLLPISVSCRYGEGVRQMTRGNQWGGWVI